MPVCGLRSGVEEDDSGKLLLDCTEHSDCTEGFGIGTGNKGRVLRISLQPAKEQTTFLTDFKKERSHMLDTYICFYESTSTILERYHGS